MTIFNIEHIQSEICGFLSNLTGECVLSGDDLRSKGIDSVALLELVIYIERELKIPFPLDLLTSQPVNTARDLASVLHSMQVSGAQKER
jgi:acyl carrier protein